MRKILVLILVLRNMFFGLKAKKHVSPFFCILVVTFSTRFVQTPLSKNDDESRVDELEKTRR